MMMPTTARAQLTVGMDLREVYLTGGCNYSNHVRPEDANQASVAGSIVETINKLVRAELAK